MDLLSGHRGGGVTRKQVVVVADTLRQSPDSIVGARAALGAFRINDDALIRRPDGPAQRPLRGGQQPRARRVVRRSQRAHLGFDVRPQRAVRAVAEGRTGDDIAGVGGDIGEHELRRQDATALRLVRPGDRLVDPFRDALEARDVGLGVRHTLHPMGVDEERRDPRLQTAHLVEEVAVVLPLGPCDRPLGVGDEDVVGEPPLRRQRAAIDVALELGELATGARETRGPFGFCDRRPLVVAQPLTELRRELRARGDTLIERALEEHRGSGISRVRDWRSRGPGGERRRRQGHTGRRQQDA